MKPTGSTLRWRVADFADAELGFDAGPAVSSDGVTPDYTPRFRWSGMW